MMPLWAFITILVWMVFIPHFTAASLKVIYIREPDAPSIPAKCVALLIGLTWPIVFVIGVVQLVTGVSRR